MVDNIGMAFRIILLNLFSAKARLKLTVNIVMNNTKNNKTKRILLPNINPAKTVITEKIKIEAAR